MLNGYRHVSPRQRYCSEAVSEKKRALNRLEPYEGKLSSTVLRGERARKSPDLPNYSSSRILIGTLFRFNVKDERFHHVMAVPVAPPSKPHRLGLFSTTDTQKSLSF